MAILSRHPLSGSTNGTAISILSSDPGQTIHTVSTATAVKDTIYLWAQNLGTDIRRLFIQFGATGSGDYIQGYIPADDWLHAIVPGLTINGGTSTGNGLIVRGYGTATTNLKIFGYVDRAS